MATEATDNHRNDQLEQHLPKVLILKPPPAFTIAGEQPFTSTKFQYLKAYDSSLPLDQFLSTHARSVQALLSSGSTTVDADLLRQLPSLRVVVNTSAGLNLIDLRECRRRGVRVANSATVYSDDVADLAVGLLIDVWRRVSAGNRFVKGGLWPLKGDYPLGSKLEGKRVGIVGLGNIGYRVGKRLEAFGCHVSYNSRKRKPDAPYPFYENVTELAADSDALVICCGLTDQTRHMISRDVLSALGKEGVIANIGRGAIIDEKEMVRCLVQGEIAGAGLDVFENEPHVPQELFHLDNVVLSPHCGVFTPESMKALSDLVVGNLEAFFSNEPLLSEYVDE